MVIIVIVSYALLTNVTSDQSLCPASVINQLSIAPLMFLHSVQSTRCRLFQKLIKLNLLLHNDVKTQHRLNLNQVRVRRNHQWHTTLSGRLAKDNIIWRDTKPITSLYAIVFSLYLGLMLVLNLC